MADNIGSLSVQITGSTAGLSQALRTAQNEVVKFQKNLEDKAKPRSQSSLLRRITGGAGSFVGQSVGAGASGVGSLLSAGARAATSLPVVAGGAIGALGIGSFLSESIKMAASVEDTQTTFRVMLGDITKARALYADIRKFSAETPLTTNEVTDAAQMLLGNGVGESQIIPTLRVLGDVASGAGQQLKDIAIIYNQVRSKGRLYAEEIMQFNERNIPLQAELARVLGVTEAQVSMLVSEGRVGFPELQRALVGMTSEGGRFFGMMEARSKTINGLLSTLRDNADQFMGKFGQAFIEEFNLGPAIEQLSKILGDSEGGVDRLRPIIRGVRDALLDAGDIAMAWMGDAVTMSARFADNFGEVLADVLSIKKAMQYLSPLLSVKMLTDGAHDTSENSFESKSAAVLNEINRHWNDTKEAVSRGGVSRPILPASPMGVDYYKEIGYTTGRVVGQSFEATIPAIGNMLGFVIERAFADRADVLNASRAFTAQQQQDKATNEFLIEMRRLAAEQSKFAQSIAATMNPRGELRKNLDNIQDIFRNGGFRVEDKFANPWLIQARAKDARDFAAAQAFDDMVRGVGITGGARLAEGAVFGSVDAASLINRNKFSIGADDVPGILKQIKQLQEQQNQRAKRIADALENAGLLKVK